MVAKGAFLLMRVRLFLSGNLILCAHPAGGLAAKGEPKLFEGFLLLARQKAPKETGTFLSKSLRSGSKEGFTDLSYTATLGRSDRFQLFLQL